jgi:ubiquinone biosynthesis protein COQ9
MDADELDAKLIASAFTLIAERGWRGLSLAEAARRAGLEPAKVRARFPDRCALLARFGTLADRAALTGALTDGPVRDRLFDIVMRRIDFLQAHRDGVKALLRELPADPLTALFLAQASLRSMAWLLDGVGVEIGGLRGALRVQGMQLVWLATVRAWQGDDSEDLAATMAALDQALTRAGQAENTLADIF